MSENNNYFDAHARSWDDNEIRVKRARDIANAIVAELELTKDMHALDFGAGTGLMTLQLAPHVGKVTAIDTSEGMLKVLHEKIDSLSMRNVETVCSDILDSDLPEEDYDLIVSTMTFHHVKDVKSVLDRLYILLKNGGNIAIADLDSEEGEYHSGEESVEHNGFERDEFGAMLVDAGFKVSNFQTVSVVRKIGRSGEEKDFSVFLVTAVKP